MPAVSVSNVVFEADVIVSLPKFKTHGLTIMTGAIKNSYGFPFGGKMSLQHYQEKILSQLIDQEYSLSRLYGLFAEQFPGMTDFWIKLSREEKRHAQLIEKLREAEKKGIVMFDEGKVKTYTLNTFLERLEKII